MVIDSHKATQPFGNKKLHKLVYVHYNMRLRVKNLMQEQSNEDLYNPIDLNHIFNDDDILDEWIQEGK